MTSDPSQERFPESKLAPLKLGPLTIDFPIIQAALAGYSDRPMRRIAKQLGAGSTIAEVMLDKFVLEVRKGSKAFRYVDIEEQEHPVGAQIMGSEPERFADAAVELFHRGFDFIDLNFGCPVKKVIGKNRGGFLLSRPDMALTIIERVRKVLPANVPVTVKMRRGLDDSPESRDAFFEILDGAFELGADAVTVHPRYVHQRYEGPSEWSFLKKVREHLGPDRTLLGSGDLFTAESCIRMMRETGVNGVAIARGAIGNPWIFREARALAAGDPLPDPPTLIEQADVMREHRTLCESLYDPPRAEMVMRKFGIRYSLLHPEPLTVRDAFVHTSSREEWLAVLDRFYCDDTPGRRPVSDGSKGEPPS